MPNQVTGYNRTQIILHWVIAALVLFQFLGADAIEHVNELIVKGQDPAIPVLARAHVLLGILTLILAIWRTILRMTRGIPDLPEGESDALKRVAKTTHFLMYAALFLMPLSGMGAWFGGQEVAVILHNIIKVVLIVSVLLHVAGAVYQQHVLKTNIIKRMMKAE